MKEYKKVLEFKYKNQKYNMYLDENNKKYFLKVDENGNLNYLTDKEFAELTIFFTSVPKIMRIRKTKEEKTKLFPKVIVGGVTVTLTLSVLLGGLNQIGVKISDFFPSTSTSEVIENEGDLENYISLELNKEKEVDTYQYKNGTNLEIYDMESLDMVMENEEITLNSLIEVINDNNSIPTYYKKLLIEYCESLTNKYPDIDLRVFYTNLKTLKINECTESEMHTKAGGEDTYGCYMKKTNEIYVIEEMDYKYNPWAHQVLFHELSHCLRIGNYEINGTKVKVQPEGPSFNNEITTEALNSIFAVSLFDYEENDIAYQLQSNYHKIMIECLDNYKLSDYVNHSLSYYTDKLNEYNENNNAEIILELIQTQFQDYYSNLIEVEQNQYYPIYDYISTMYYNKYITEDMTYEEMEAINDELVSKVTLYVPDEYKIDTERFHENLESYINQIENESKTR